MMNYLRNHIGTFILVFSILTFIAPKLFILPGLDCFDFSETGQIGDTIGGITAPFLGFLSVILLYFTLKEQQDFNKNQQLVNEKKELITKLYRIIMVNNIIEDIKSKVPIIIIKLNKLKLNANNSV